MKRTEPLYKLHTCSIKVSLADSCVAFAQSLAEKLGLFTWWDKTEVPKCNSPIVYLT